ncbi:MAG: ABC transporter permease, partial [Ignavibacteriaceae bacterium]|nr:ABC transporter permease [Ignavibacteriaceae bacterium]
AVYQRVTGPTYPVSGEVMIDANQIDYKLARSHGGEGDHQIEIEVKDQAACAELVWKRYKTNDEWTSVKMIRQGNKLIASLPHQPPAGKLLYHITFQKNDEVVTIPEGGGVVIRFKGDVPVYFLIPHIIFIFGAMLLSTRTGLEYFNKGKKFKPLTILTFIFMIIGGFILGPIIQYYAFGAFWTGFPFGHDLTDNKILIGFIGWLIALIAIYRFKNPKRWIVFASILMFIIFLIPHSVLGSEIDYNKLDESVKTSRELND